MNEIDTILFDLDGTLVDTAPDMVAALNRLLAAEGRPPVALEQARAHVSNGATALLRLAFGEADASAPDSPRHRAFLEYYAADIAAASLPFPQIAQLLDDIEQARMAWGVVTNKPGWLTTPLLAALNLEQRAACIVAGDTLTRRKPDPEPIRYACRLAGTTPARTVYVGDAERDIEAGRAAGARTLVALFGYIEPDADPSQWQADGSLHEPNDLWKHVRRPTLADPPP